MTYTLAHTSPARVFATIDTINSQGALAVAPRELRIVDGKPSPAPIWGGYVFIAATDDQWHSLDHLPNFTRPHAVQPISPRVWQSLQGMLARADAAYQRQCDQWERGDIVAKLRKGDRVQIIGDAPLFGLLGDMLGTYISGDATQAHIQLDGPGLLGKPVVRTVQAVNIAPLPQP